MIKKLGLAILVVFLAIGLSSMLIMIREDKAENDVSSIQQNIITVNDNNLSINNSTSTSSGISLTDLAIHNSLSSCWVIYNNKVYDLTNFLPNHPGSASAILPYCGSQDFEQAFVDQHGTTKVSMLMKVGILIGDFKIIGSSV